MKRLTEFFPWCCSRNEKSELAKEKRINEIYNCCYFDCSHYALFFTVIDYGISELIRIVIE